VGFAQVTGWPAPVQRLEADVGPASPAGEHARSEHTYGGPAGPPLLYFPAVLPVRSVRISLLNCGAKRARTADLLHAIQRQPVHQNTYVQVTVPESARWSGCVRACCGTFLLYRSARRQIRSRRAPPRAAGRFPVSDIGDELDRLAGYCRDSLVITVIAEHCEPFRAPR
jgi:hypothetical protein